MITRDEKKIGAVLVEGGGIAGVQASLDLANSGFKVYLVEREAAIGGVLPNPQRLPSCRTQCFIY